MSKQRSTVTCGFINCVADIPRDDAFKDELGTFWCDKHRMRGVLINYGVKHEFPEVHCPPYAIGDSHHDDELWKIAAALGSEPVIHAAVSALGLAEEEARWIPSNF